MAQRRLTWKEHTSLLRRIFVGLSVAALILTGCARQEPREAPPVETPVAQAPQPEPAPEPEPPAPPPEPRVTISPAQVLQGDFAEVRLDQAVAGEVKVRVEGIWEQPRVHRQFDKPVAFIGVPAAQKAGDYPVTVTWSGGEWKGTLTVVKKQFTEDRLVVSEQLEQTYYDPRSDEEWARVNKLRSTSQPKSLWEGPFLQPLKGDLRITTYFGEIRFVNGVETGRHSGMDFGAPTGTPIYAPARGKVILAEKLILSGNMVIIDHGMSLFTAYYHCDKLLVKPGDWVNPGQQIATVGNTGFSTGPHLHWTATIGNIAVYPWPLTEASPLGVRTAPRKSPDLPLN